MPEAVTVGRVVSGLLAEVGRTSGFDEASEALLESVLEPIRSRAGVLLVRTDDGVRGWGWRVGPEVAAAASAAAGVEASRLSALFSIESVRDLRSIALYRIGDFSPAVALPLVPGPPNVQGIILAGAPGDEAGIALAAGALRHCSATVLRILELELVRERTEHPTPETRHRERILDAIADPVLLIDADGKVVLANRRANQLLLTDPTATQARNRAVRINALHFDARLTEPGDPGREAESWELTLVDPLGGTDLLFEMRTYRLERESGSDGYRIAVLRDVTDVKRASAELEMEYKRSRVAEHRAREESKRLNAIIENVAEPIVVTDARSDIVLINREGERLFQAPADALEGDERATLVSKNVTQLTSFVSEFLLSVSTRRVRQLTLMDLDRRAGFPVEATGTRIENQRGETTAVVTVLRDLTPLVENERLTVQLRNLNDELEDRIEAATGELEERNRLLEWQSQELEKASRLKTQFLASMSHELRTPINAMLGYTSLLQEQVYGSLTEEQQEVLAKVDAASEHLLDLVNDILDLTRIEAGRMPLRVEAVDLPELFSEMRETVEPLLRDKPVELRVEVGASLPTLRTDRKKIRQVMLNLLGNAVKFTPEGAVMLRAEMVDDGRERVRLEVEDTGVGIPGEDLEHIFEDFRQGDQTHAREYAGTGLGLSISRKLVSLMGGRIEAESVVGEGTCFRIELPLRLDPDRTRQERSGAPVAAPPAETGSAAGGSRHDNLMSTVAHALKDPLHRIVGYADLLAMGRYGDLDPQLRPVVDQIGRGGRCAAGRVDSVIGLVALAADRGALSAGGGASIAEPARTAARRLADEADDRGVRLEVVVDDVPPVAGTPDRLHHLLRILLRLAILDAGPGLVRLTAETVGGGEVGFRVQRLETAPGRERASAAPSAEPFEDDGRLEHGLLRVMAETLGGRLEPDAPGSEDGGVPVVRLPRADARP